MQSASSHPVDGVENRFFNAHEEGTRRDRHHFIRSKVFAATAQTVAVERKTRSTSFHCILACASSVVELWFAVADFPKGALGADVVTKAKKV